MPPDTPNVAFHAPLKPPDHPTPSGDRTIARLMVAALRRASFNPILISRLRTLDLTGDQMVQRALCCQAGSEISRCAKGPAPQLWFTYHSHYKAPDLLGPALAARWRIPYVIAEPSHAPRQRSGPWSVFAARNEAALKAAKKLFWTTPRDHPALAALVDEAALVPLPAFLDVGDAPQRPVPEPGPLRLLTVAMMRPGDKLASYAALAAGLARTTAPFTLTVVGDGPARTEVEALLAPFAPRYLGLIDDAAALRETFAAATLLAWPGVGEGVGMVYLEAQAAGLPCVAEDRPAQAALLAPSCWLTAPGDPAALASALAAAAQDPWALAARGEAARRHVIAHNSMEAAATRLRDTLNPLLGNRK